MTPPPTAFRSRSACLSERDWQRFSDLLAEEYPLARYYHGKNWDALAPKRQFPPHLLISRSLYRLYHSSMRWRDSIRMVFDPEWYPTWRRVWRHDGSRNDGSFRMFPAAHPTVLFQLGHGVRQGGRGLGSDYENDDLVYIDGADITVYCDPANKAHFQLARRFFRLFGRIATNKGLVEVIYPERSVNPIDRNWLWAGHDAIRWASEDPNRLLTRSFWRDQQKGLRPAAAEVSATDGHASSEDKAG